MAVTGTVNRTANWVTAYIVVASIGLTMVGLVMLFSAGAVRGAQDLLLKQVVWVVISLLAGLYASMVNLEWLEKTFGDYFCPVHAWASFNAGAGSWG